jgi:hypothetical protein
VFISRFDGLGKNHTENALFCANSNNTHHDACEACYHIPTGDYDTTTEMKAIDENLRAMKLGDHIAMFLVATMVAVSVARELDDIFVCRMMRQGYFEENEGEDEHKPTWRKNEFVPHHVPLMMVEFLRHWVLLPMITKTVAWLVL